MTRLTSLVLVLAGLALVSPAGASDGLVWTRVAKAEPDECYNGFGEPYLDIAECGQDGIPKRNHTYAWTMLESQRRLWIGTGANIAYIARALAGEPVQIETDELVIEAASSQFPGVPEPVRAFIGDWRPPQIWVHDLETGGQVEVTPNDARLDFTLGLRSAGAHDGVVILAGPTFFGLGINLFAFDARSMEYLGSFTSWRFSNIRDWLVVNGVMYTGVQYTFGPGADGAVLRWTGDRDDPFRFEVVGQIDNDAANLAAHDGRLFVGTWSPSPGSSLAALLDISPDAPPAALWMSPRIPPWGLRPYHANAWSAVWRISDYEPDRAIALSYGVGDLVSFGDYLYWGTINPPTASLFALQLVHGRIDDDALARVNSARSVAVFRGRGFGRVLTPAQIDLLYGESSLMVYEPARENAPERWTLTPNAMGAAPVFGGSGFDNPENVYTWSTAVFEGELYVGLNEFVEDVASPGADLWRFPSTASPAVLVDDSGLTTRLNEGVRVMTATPGALYLGMTNNANLSPEGGWEIIRLERTAPH